ncbi:MAG TPA: GntG family PLP-dependent aldolase [Flavitalea sp.]|nr:GntG family PLP-dependent aldolase [Flavitalea sp.]
MIIDLRSDTFTKPTAAMQEAMWKAPVGDDVFGEDPTVNKLESTVATYFGKEAALYCPSGTMSNQIGIKAHTQPGDEVICDRSAHVYQYEGGGIAFNSGAQVKLLEGERGLVTAVQVKESINPDDVHKARTSLVCLENTANRGGGSCYEMSEIRKIRQVCEENHLLLHLDGARLFNALVAKKQKAKEYGRLFDSISVCFNKGMGCPIGSVLTGNSAFIQKSRRIRKVFGGGMRQAGFMAASALFALEHHIERLEEDHLHAKLIANALSKKDFVNDILPVETNIVIFSTKVSPPLIAERFLTENIRVIPISSTQIRMVLHLDITIEMVKKTIQVIEKMETALQHS